MKHAPNDGDDAEPQSGKDVIMTSVRHFIALGKQLIRNPANPDAAWTAEAYLLANQVPPEVVDSMKVIGGFDPEDLSPRQLEQVINTQMALHASMKSQ